MAAPLMALEGIPEVVKEVRNTAEGVWDWVAEEGGFRENANRDGAKALTGLGLIAALKLYQWGKTWDTRLATFFDAFTAWTGTAQKDIQAVEKDLQNIAGWL